MSDDNVDLHVELCISISRCVSKQARPTRLHARTFHRLFHRFIATSNPCRMAVVGVLVSRMYY